MKSKSIIILLFLLLFTVYINAQSKPNIVFILIDDMGWTDLGFMGSEFYQTPNIDNLASKGMIFTNAYSNAANCAPTRANLLTGQYSPRHGVYTVGSSERGESELRRLIPIKNSTEISFNKITIAEALKKAGYLSAAIGKWHIGNTPQQHGFDFAVDRNQLQVKGHFRKNGEYLTDLLTSEATDFIERNNPKKTKKPFFLYLAHHAVHTPIQAKKEMINEFEDNAGTGCHNHATYAAMIKSVDESVANIQKTLKKLDIDKNTLIIFFSDNGGHGTYTCQKPLRGGKGMYYEGGIRVPMFAYWPGTIDATQKCDIPVISTDFYPTFMELAGIKGSDNYILDGKSIVPLLKGRETIQRDAIFWHFPAYLQAYEGLQNESRDKLFRTRPVTVIRKGDWKLLQFHEEWVLDGGENQLSNNNSVELYNLKEDTGERNNLCNIETDKRNELLEELLKWQKEISAPVPTKANPEFSRK